MAEEIPFPTLRYDRLCRTPYSEAFLLSEAERPLGRVDLHYGSAVVHAVLLVEQELDDADVRSLIERIDGDVVWTSDRPRDDFLVTVYRGQEVGMFSDEEDDEDDDDEVRGEP